VQGKDIREGFVMAIEGVEIGYLARVYQGCGVCDWIAAGPLGRFVADTSKRAQELVRRAHWEAQQ
jgi:hypothetical protein